MANTFFKLLATYVTEGAGLISEFWIIGLMHEIGRHTVYFNGNINSPKVGYFFAVAFSLFYLGRICGTLFGIGFADRRKHVLFTYLTYFPLIIATYFQSFYTGALWIFASRVIIGFLSGFSPVMCMLRAECGKTQLLSKIRDAGQRTGTDLTTGGKAKVRTTGVAPILPATIEFLCAYGVIGLSSLVYNHEKLDITMPTWIFTILLLIGFCVFFAAFKCKEEPNVNSHPAVKSYMQQFEGVRKAKKNRYADKAPGLLSFFFQDEDLSLNTFAVTLYEAARMVDMVYMILMIQTNPYYKGIWVERRIVLIVIVVAAFVALMFQSLITRAVDRDDAVPWMKWTAIASIIIYPLCNTLVNFFSYKSPNWAIFTFGVFEVVKFLMLYIMRDGLDECINKEFEGTNNPKEDNYRALGQFSEDFMKFLTFTLCGYVISYCMGSLYVQRMNPYNYTVGFLVLVIPLLLTFFLLTIAAAIDDDDDK